ncbi:ModD protein [uncultured Cohaesibacter sp.]|uniref:ModD protein n=1 Tax=uncultured Cohaesibacter sp. TaxID=1002546 RepID=UPI00292D6E81|nr:ModD protein [uncultured Cohaesibacter sp.]
MISLDDATLMSYLREDVPYGDMTTRPLQLDGEEAVMTFSARGDMTVCAIEEAGRLLELIGCTVVLYVHSGDSVASGHLLLRAQGRADVILMGWKVSQVMVEWASGVASASAALVVAAREVRDNAVIACTRKAVPGTRALSAKAIMSGGAALHRTGLSDTILLFPEHRSLAEPLMSLPEQIASLKQANPERNVVVEVKSIEEALDVAAAGADVLQLEKFSPSDISLLLEKLGGKGRPKIAAAGGINPGNVGDYARTGVEILVTSYPYYAKPADVQVRIEKP